jgi:sugar/nucleoside kinase (ribokinase family)
MSDYRTTMETWIQRGKELVVCTHGKDGSTTLTKDGKWIQNKIIGDYKFKDDNGAGDSFFSGFLYGFLKEKSIEDCLKLATICAVLCITLNELAYKDLSEELINSEYNKCYGQI